ncbi:uncharacterized protein PGTG_01803 [Puccinia graminis f. sp. tritici CRL 75-36-700-3]|uniref:GCM domain-containing protein n=1 Tax=Puccinia graminis f. sp. tritici (strain CRL 75-36-700-3 / race SCCL) TaxID=418459 RepID=E3JTD6_PUCGT|nr:uncharacterized protein PGTG_01803 [Puccinia graminis f. sp. tritici CRL 75-36-700-3]EFP75210.1 hypothetical protein PGTG_01803 [Puccinia graminis f. sp. tritici CRL 75-36-700-3]
MSDGTSELKVTSQLDAIEAADFEPIKGKKIFFAPSGNEQTFIDHDCKLDDDGYPIYPNRQTVFVKTPDMVVRNFGFVGFTKTSNVEWRADRSWKMVRISCLGALICNEPGCQWVGSPPTAKDAIKEYLQTQPTRNPKCPGAAGKCPGKVAHQACNNTMTRFDENKLTNWAILRHHGIHHHPWPAPKKPDPLSKLKLKNEIMKNPTAGAFKLKLGKPTAPLNPFESVTKIHDSFVNSDRVRYHRRLILTDLGINPHKGGAGLGDKFLLDMFQWNHVGLLIISSSFKPGIEHFTFQTKWMAERLVSRDHNNEVYGGGLLSDVTYRLFETGYLLSTSMFCEETARWIPVQLSWIRGLSAEYYQAHFSTLFEQFDRPGFTVNDRDTLVRQVVDFSLAQREGFISAYMKVFRVTDRQQALSKLKGCHEHFRAQVTRVKRNRAVVPPEQEAQFQKLCLDLLILPEAGKPCHEQKIDELRRLFPKTKRWLDWWTMVDIEAILFPSKRAMITESANGKDNLPDTTNAQESMHRLYYMISEGKKCLLIGMAELFAFVKALEDDWHAVMRGVSIEYGAKNKSQQDLAISIGWQKPPKRNPANRKKVELNDGRAPDTTATLLPQPKNVGGRPKNSHNLIKDPFSTYISYSASQDSAKKNRCWLAAALESLYAMFNPLWLCGTNGLKSDIFTTLVKHFNSRSSWELSLSGHIRSFLSIGQNSLHAAANKISPGCFNPGVFCSADLFIDLLIDPHIRKQSKTIYPPRDLFTVTEVRTATCELQPEVDQVHPRGVREVTVLRIQKETFDSANIEPFSVQQLISVWTTDGISSVSGLCCKLCPSTKKQEEPHHIVERSVFTVENGGPPQHLYLLVQVSSIFDEADQQTFMAGLDFPFQLEFHGVSYTLFSRGFWNGVHYWSKMLKNIGGISGVWIHDDRENGGIARLISPDHTTIAGLAAHTSWVFYSRPWNRSEEKFVEDSIAKITQDNKGAPGTMPFAHLGQLLSLSPNRLLPATEYTSTAMSAGSTVSKGDPSASFTADPPEDLKREVSGLEDVKRKASGEFKIRLKVLKPSNPRQPTEQDNNHTKLKNADQKQPGKCEVKKVGESKSKTSVAKAKVIKPTRSATRASTRKALQN